MPPRPSSATIRYRLPSLVPGSKRPCSPEEAADGGEYECAAAAGADVRVGSGPGACVASATSVGTPHDGQNRWASETTAEQRGQVVIWVCRGSLAPSPSAVKQPLAVTGRHGTPGSATSSRGVA